MIIEYIESLLGEAKWNSAGTEAQFQCPFCQDYKRRLYINAEKLLCNCFNCGWKGNIAQFIKDYQGLSWSEAVDILQFYDSYRPLPKDLYDELFERVYMEGIELEKKPNPLPPEFHLLVDSDIKEAKRFWKYAFKRRLTPKQIKLHGVGYSTYYKLKNRLIIQVFDDSGRSIYWIARSIYPNVDPKTLNPPSKKGYFAKSDVLFNLNNASQYEAVVITEGIFDAITVGDVAVALFGKTMSIKQLALLLESGIKKAYVMLDPDAKQEAVQISLILSRHLKEVFICDLKKGDPNKVGRKACLEAIKSAEKFDKLTAVKYKLL